MSIFPFSTQSVTIIFQKHRDYTVIYPREDHLWELKAVPWKFVALSRAVPAFRLQTLQEPPVDRSDVIIIKKC